jgi:multidrug efflux pump subunit AcrB
LDEEKVFLNGERAAVLQIAKTKSEDTLRVIDAVNAFLEREGQMSPPRVRFVVTQDFSSIVRDRLQLLVVNGFLGLALVFLTMWLFFGFRFSFWVAMGLPVSFLGALFFMSWFDYSINMITMVALLLALGLLMDDAIVISERIAVHSRLGKTPLQAVIDGTSDVQRGVLSSFLTTICVFGPLAFMEGNIGKVMKVMPVVLILVLAVSLIEAFWILPNHLSHSLDRADVRGTRRFRQRIDDVIAWVQEHVLGRVVDFAVSWRYLFWGFVLMVFLFSIGMIAGGRLKFRAFPGIDGDVVVARILLPQGTPLVRTEAVVKRVTQALDRVNSEFTARQPERQSLVRNVIVQYNLNTDAFEAGPHVATVFVDLLGAERRNARVDDVLNRWREKVGNLPDVLNVKFTEPQIGPAGLPIDIRLQGNDLAKLKEASIEMQAWLDSFAGVSDLSDDLRPGKPEIRARLRKGSTALGLDAATIATQLRAAFYGKKAGEIQVGPESYEIDVRLASSKHKSLADLEYFHVTLPGGKQVPIETVSTLEFGRGFARIARVDGLRTVSIQGEVDAKATNTAEIIQELNERFLPDFQKRYPSIRVSLEGEAKESETTGGSLRRAFLLGIIGVFMLLSFQFKSYIEPLVVMVAIPFAFIGVIWGHLIMGLALSMPSVVGFVSLAGVVVNDSILLVEFVKRRQREGESVGDAARLASRERFRAVLLTSLTTIAGLLPLLAERSLQAQVLIPLATSIVFGLAASTILVLCVVPSLYAILGDFNLLSKPT